MKTTFIQVCSRLTCQALPLDQRHNCPRHRNCQNVKYSVAQSFRQSFLPTKQIRKFENFDCRSILEASSVINSMSSDVQIQHCTFAIWYINHFRGSNKLSLQIRCESLISTENYITKIGKKNTKNVKMKLQQIICASFTMTNPLWPDMKAPDSDKIILGLVYIAVHSGTCYIWYIIYDI